MRAILKCLKCNHVWSCRGISEPDVGIDCMPDEGDPDSNCCPECGNDEWEHIDSEVDDGNDF